MIINEDMVNLRILTEMYLCVIIGRLQVSGEKECDLN